MTFYTLTVSGDTVNPQGAEEEIASFRCPEKKVLKIAEEESVFEKDSIISVYDSAQRLVARFRDGKLTWGSRLDLYPVLGTVSSPRSGESYVAFH